MREPLAGAARAALHFVDHQQPAVAVANRACRLQIIDVRGLDPALALDGLEKDRDDIGVGIGDLLQCRRIVQRHAHEALDQRLETFLHLGIGGRRQRGQRAAMEGAFEHHDFRPGDTAIVAVQPGQLDCRLVRFQSGIAEKRRIHLAQDAKPVGQLFLQGNAIQIGAVDELAHLIGEGRHQPRMRMAQGVDRDARQGVEIAATLRIPDPCTLAMRQRDRQAGIGVHQMCGHGHLLEAGKN
ncbi:hypothetical protein GALL_472500 [mine drainage metagenome]|uniref:Uncharacterized protein n=1 Tax=mine drainage metagenome TaxID=410659 RepID=A0A1J5Q5D3_9ZZZZ